VVRHGDGFSHVYHRSVYPGDPFLVKYTLAASRRVLSTHFRGVVFITAILSVFIWGRLIRILGIKRTWLWSVGVMAASALIVGLASNLVVGAIGAAVRLGQGWEGSRSAV